MTAVDYAHIQEKRGTAATWTADNPVLLQGEVGFETDTGKKKTGDGSTAWNSLGYDYLTPSEVSAAYVAVAGAISSVTRDGSNRLTGFTENSQVVSSITRDGTTGLVTSFDVNGVTHTVTRDGSNRVTGVS